MQIKINGETRELARPVLLQELLDQLELASPHYAVEVNLELIPRERHAQHALQDGDQLEIVTLAGGG